VIDFVGIHGKLAEHTEKAFPDLPLVHLVGFPQRLLCHLEMASVFLRQV
jgi:hypothetical protein